MIVQFPEPYEDELMYSVFARYFIRSGGICIRMVKEELFQKVPLITSTEFIDRTTDEVNTLLPYPRSVIINNHTMFQCRTKFMPAVNKQKMYRSLLDNSGRLGSVMALRRKNREDEYLRYCPVCVRMDRRKYGETYWHTSHQIPGMPICPRHNCFLVNSTVPIHRHREKCDLITAESEVRAASYNTTLCGSVDARVVEYIAKVLKTDVQCADYAIHQRLKSDLRDRESILPEMERAGFSKALLPRECELDSVLDKKSDKFSVICKLSYLIGLSVYEVKNICKQCAKMDPYRGRRASKQNDYEALDKEMIQKLSNVVNDIYYGNENRIPQRISIYRIEREVGLKSGMLKRMPQCRKIVENYMESIMDFRKRKVIWAIKYIDRNQMLETIANIQKLTKVEVSQIKEVMKSLEQQ